MLVQLTTHAMKKTKAVLYPSVRFERIIFLFNPLAPFLSSFFSTAFACGTQFSRIIFVMTLCP